jgi:hypothetical protein
VPQKYILSKNVYIHKDISKKELDRISSFSGLLCHTVWWLDTTATPRKVFSSLQLVKDILGLKTPGIYRILCERCKVYNGQTGHSSETRMEEHHWHTQLCHSDKSAMAEYNSNLGHYIQFNDTSILAKKPSHMECIIMKVI